MANHGFGYIKQELSVEQINNDLLEINNNRFNNLFIITHGGDNREKIWSFELENSPINFLIWLNKNNKIKKIEYLHNTWGNSGLWFQETFVSILVSKYNGFLSNDGVDGKWEPDFHIKYPHMIDWFMWGLKHTQNKILRFIFKMIFKGEYNNELRHLPEKIKELI